MPPELLTGSVIAVPPLARKPDFSINVEENRRMIQYLEAGGVTTLLYGGNANLYHVRLHEYEALLQMLSELPDPQTAVIPSMGPSFGMMTAQVEVLQQFDFPSVMILPTTDAASSDGIATGIRHTAELYGNPIVLYIKQQNGLSSADVIRLVEDGVVAAIKYAIVREDVSDDVYLKTLLDGVDANIVISGMGEQPAMIHMRDFGLAGFTSGCVCVAPALSQRMLSALQAHDYLQAEKIRQTFAPLEDLRNQIHPIRVLHEAVKLGGIANTGPLLPLLSNLETQHHEAVKVATLSLMEQELAP